VGYELTAKSGAFNGILAFRIPYDGSLVDEDEDS